jgi:regulator of sirC expression with transglutaminase-like and TPR domain
VTLDPDDGLALSKRGFLRAGQGDRAGALGDLKKALELGVPSPHERAAIQSTILELQR